MAKNLYGHVVSVADIANKATSHTKYSDKVDANPVGFSHSTNEELIAELEFFGCDPYYYTAWQQVVAELKKRLIP